MTANVGTVDRVLRALIGIILIALPFTTFVPALQSGVMTYVSVIVGVVLLATAVFSFCPIYRVLGMKTCRT